MDLLDITERTREVYVEKAALLFDPKWRSNIATVHMGAKDEVTADEMP